MKLGQPYQITFENGITIVCTFLGDKDNVQDAVKILESNSERFVVGTLISLDVINMIPQKDVIPVNR